MAENFYTPFLDGLMDGAFNFGTIDVSAVIVSTTTGGTLAADFPFNAADEFFSSCNTLAIVAGPVALTTVVQSNGTVSADSIITFPTIAATAPQTGQAVVFFENTGTASTSRLIGHNTSYTNLPVAPNGEDITITLSSYLLRTTYTP